MALLKLAALGAIGYAGYRYYQSSQNNSPAAFAGGQPRDYDKTDEVTPVRDSGPASMRDKPRRDWTKTDESSDQSFPASDPPANY
ncbi:hypothetical protein [Croceicoccus marinus]|jgi:uncharacterized membrane protein YebE (DUF533 family)|uniref:Uncharacterized protein n=1 Tax=Croceicoccus marinus TaxID=450378 RepID=A0A7G6VVK3_9SPHN|nr:hypothetical protein [Croceicoccus marinus]QNE05768.1 hypothetical protein H4O24_03580 [Croceicoccus marinus]